MKLSSVLEVTCFGWVDVILESSELVFDELLPSNRRKAFLLAYLLAVFKLSIDGRSCYFSKGLADQVL